ncbi:hypothetical protein CYMTET_49056 [Cymbomonas tetramitiformis]|uniref:Uncharacterized protein n=1 Tax=Cymbomonas tetramitiformis TaxID=36881 RepID=A0AAE0BS79_9CHLO|nr:hypothetical protein CYMTET_49056 [Cymbomonas tetramitiformis]
MVVSEPRAEFRGRRVAKDFDGETFYGVISIDFSGPYYYRVKYDDGDEENYRLDQLLSAGILLPQTTAVLTKGRKRRQDLAKAKPRKTRRSGGPHISALDLRAALPQPAGPQMVNVESQTLNPSCKPSNFELCGLQPTMVELFFRYLHARHVARAKRGIDAVERPARSIPDPLCVDYILQSTFTGNVYRHLDTGTQGFGRAVRERLRAIVSRDPENEAVAIEALNRSLRMAVLAMAVGREETFAEWASERADEPPYPGTVGELEQFREFLRKRGEKRQVTFTDAYQTVGFRKTCEMIDSLICDGAAVARQVYCSCTWAQAVAALRQIHFVGPFFGAQALCEVWHGVVQGDEPQGWFRCCLMPSMNPASLNEFTTPGPGPIKALSEMFGGIYGTHVEKMQWLSQNAEGAFDLLGLEFPWLVTKAPQSGASLGGAIGKTLHGAGRRRYMNVVDMEHSLCYFHSYHTARARIGKEAKAVHDTLQLLQARVPLCKLEVFNTRASLQRWAHALCQKSGCSASACRESGAPSIADICKQVETAAAVLQYLKPGRSLHVLLSLPSAPSRT